MPILSQTFFQNKADFTSLYPDEPVSVARQDIDNRNFIMEFIDFQDQGYRFVIFTRAFSSHPRDVFKNARICCFNPLTQEDVASGFTNEQNYVVLDHVLTSITPEEKLKLNRYDIELLERDRELYRVFQAVDESPGMQEAKADRHTLG